MSRFRFPIAVAATSLALVLGLVVVAGLVVPNALARGFWGMGPGGPWAAHAFGGPGFDLPPELQGLHDLPPSERFGHFRGVQISLTDKDGKALAINASPGTARTVSATSLTIAANDGSSKTFSLNDQTVIRGKRVQGGAQASQPTLSQDDKVVVMTLNNSTTATAVMVVPAEGFGPRGGHWGSPRG